MLHIAHHTDLAHSEGPAELRLAGTTVDMQLTGDHAETGQVVNVMREHRETPVDVGDGGALSQKNRCSG